MKKVILLSAILVVSLFCSSSIFAGGPKPSAYLYISRTFDHGKYCFVHGYIFESKNMDNLAKAIDALDNYLQKKYGENKVFKVSSRKRFKMALDFIRWYDDYSPEELKKISSEQRKHPAMLLTSAKINVIIARTEIAMNDLSPNNIPLLGD